MKFGIDIGHNCPPDTGAGGIRGGRQEDVLTKEVGTKVIAKLRTLGHTVVECKPPSATSVPHSLRQRVDKANSSGVARFVCVHFNSFNGSAKGTEVFATSAQGIAIAKSVVDKIAGLGFVKRSQPGWPPGVKDGSHLFVIKHTAMPAILVECCFCDSSADMSLFSTVGADRIADAIVQGIT